MLLNVGPTPQGEITPEETERLEAIGRWMETNGEAIYGTQGGPFPFDFEWGSMSQKPGRLYLHILAWDPNELRLDGLRTDVTRAYLLSDPDRGDLEIEQDVAAGKLRLTGLAPRRMRTSP